MIVPLFVGIVAVFLILFCASELWSAKQSDSWPKTRGTIIESHASHGSKHPSAYIRYEYKVGNVSYEGDRLSYSPSEERFYGNSGNLQARFYKGAVINVYYDPNSPSDSVLVPGYEQTLNEYGGIISGFFMLGIAVLVGWIIHKNRQGNAKPS